MSQIFAFMQQILQYLYITLKSWTNPHLSQLQLKHHQRFSIFIAFSFMIVLFHIYIICSFLLAILLLIRFLCVNNLTSNFSDLFLLIRVFKFFFKQTLPIIFIDSFQYPLCMKSSNYQCVNCQVEFDKEPQYMAHYKSEYHRYNIKRRFIGLPPLSEHDYLLQIEDDKTSKESSQFQFYCEICCKKFMSGGTYKQHLGSKKHKANREKIKAPEKTVLSKSSSSSDFQIIGGEKVQFCFFCHQNMTGNHLRHEHNFPPFPQQCINQDGLTEHVKTKIAECFCVYCDMKFNSEESVRQHMMDVGHAKLNLSSFTEYEEYYLWKIEESSSESEHELETGIHQIHSRQNSFYEPLDHLTLEEIEKKRLERIKLTTTGAMINGKEVGMRCYRSYYKQYLDRHLENDKYKYQPAIEGDKGAWKQMKGANFRSSERPPKITQMINSR